MADEEGKENAPRGHEWEVVSLTASAYAAAPGPEKVDPTEDSLDEIESKNEAGTSSPMLMSRHFDFPPSQHENLPLEPEFVVSQLGREGEVESEVKGEENTAFEELIADEFPGNPISYDKEVAFENAQSIYSSEMLSNVEEDEWIGDSDEPLDFALGTDPQDILQKPMEGDKCDGVGLPCEAWWKRRAVSLYAHARKANTFWSVFIAAAIMGLVVIGHRWQQESWKALHLKWQFGINNERMGRMMGPLTRFKDVIIGGQRRGSLIRGSSSSEL